MELNINLITVGKYKDKYLQDMLKDRNYCKWIIQQDWFKESYEYLYNKVKEYDPKVYFYNERENINFIEDYKYFNFTPVEELKINLSDSELLCYTFYLKTINELKTKIKVRITKNDDNIYDITAPSKWLQKFENETGLKREDFKTFISSYELPNITSILEDIKTLGGIEYKGSQSFKIAKKRSSEQENHWEIILKEKYKDLLGTQFKYESCIFDFINISTNTIFECKLNLKDFNEEQYNKYLLTLDKYNIIYLIGTDCIINMDLETIYTTDLAKYILYQCNIPVMKNPSKFDELIFDFDIYEVHEITDGIF